MSTDGTADTGVQADDASPELVLVDPELAVRARERLADADDTLSRPRDLPPVRRVRPVSHTPNGDRSATLEEKTAAFRRLSGAASAGSAAQPAVPRARRLRRLVAFASSALAALSVAVYVVDLQLRSQETAPAADRSTTGKPPVSAEVSTDAARAGTSTKKTEPRSVLQARAKAAARSPARKKTDAPPAETAAPAESPTSANDGSARPQPGTGASENDASPVRKPPATDASPTPGRLPLSRKPQSFAWAPAARASAYHVELFSGGTRVFAADTRRPAITISAAWTLRGRRHRLQPGAYSWYVWPIVSGERAAKAIVRSTFVVRGR